LGAEVWLASQEGSGRVWVSHAPWGQWEPEDWSAAELIGDYRHPDIAWSREGGFFISAIASSPGTGKLQGPIMLSRSDDGDTWTEARPTLPGVEAVSAGIAASDEAGLVAVYHVLGDDDMALWAARSADFGTTWGQGVRISEPGLVTHDARALVHDGRLYVSYVTLPAASLQPGHGRYIDNVVRFTGIESVRVLAMDVLDLPAE
jgi:hypothetical protein